MTFQKQNRLTALRTMAGTAVGTAVMMNFIRPTTADGGLESFRKQG